MIGLVSNDVELLTIDVTSFRSNASDQKDFIHNLRIMGAFYTDSIKGSPYLADFTDDDYYN
jgi:hypothetical protein